ncbi:GIY-YIG nuclease family protein [Ancylomarina longa]|uniref:GIY-YIG nuclease family protein n=1 Tax=Ancylomarina longa TaxID=2487017 RepID=A0A434B062_9BACT|nr:GIY-YIG nuclease family protein [Ancylomarina longa]RUT80196.1 GIY-YIG nuclease family protein [Ancylomarina longa]
MKRSYIYIMSNKNRTTLYIGVTSDLNRRIAEHSEGIGAKFTSKYNLTDLVYYEEFDDVRDAIAREKQLKNWKREWKMKLIKSFNPDLKDLKMDFQ